MQKADLAIVGAGAAGLMAAISAGRILRGKRIVLLEGQPRIGAKILISGGGRCNVTHDTVDESSFSGSTPPAIRKVLRRFGVDQSVRFFAELGVRLKREETGKLFPVTDRAQTVLDALLKAASSAGAQTQLSARVEHIDSEGDLFRLRGGWGSLQARRLILSTGGRSVASTGSDGHGYVLARSLGHTVTPLFPALVPLLLPKDHLLTQLSGLSSRACLEVRGGSGKTMASFTDSVLCTHFGLSGPGTLDVSRHYLAELAADPQTKLFANWLPGYTTQSADEELRAPGSGGVLNRLRGKLPERLLRRLCEEAGVDPAASCARLKREARQQLVRLLTAMELPVTGSRGFRFAEVTAGGVPLNELRLETLESRVRPGLHLCGEICDVDGRIGGYNFQWAWSSGFVAGAGAAAALK